MKRAEYALLGPELEHLAKQSGAGLLEEGGSCLIVAALFKLCLHCRCVNVIFKYKDMKCLSSMTLTIFFGEMSSQQLFGAKRVTEGLCG